MGKEYLADPKKAPPLNVPQSEVVVKLSIIDSYVLQFSHGQKTQHPGLKLVK